MIDGIISGHGYARGECEARDSHSRQGIGVKSAIITIMRSASRDVWRNEARYWSIVWTATDQAK
jgi:hypothetical protein